MSDPDGAAPDFERVVQAALDSLPSELRDRISNVEIVVEDEPPPGQPLLGLYQGVPLTRRGSGYSGALPDKITIYRGPLERLYGRDRELLERQIRHVVLHEVAHHFGISDAQADRDRPLLTVVFRGSARPGSYRGPTPNERTGWLQSDSRQWRRCSASSASGKSGRRRS